ncbi:interferon-induced, double-stranded RNA-activated protein kinase-like [Limanda limanda]|uniref:interferon-induced, double-stranded RNA-activated protein kinase-like n=1 Tax=Limanda limanda TaxID=27771 RepID=UPI0029C79200|nr:interferon-induced, double-stranded RNA-activated protein kinase-like [Limanda limanda]
MATGNYVPELMEYAQKTGSKVTFEELSSVGQDHEKIFTQRVVFNGKEYPEGVGTTKREAKRNAAGYAWSGLLENEHARDHTMASSQSSPMSISDSIVFMDTSNPHNNQVAVENKGRTDRVSSTPTKSRFTSEFDSIKYLGGGTFGRVCEVREILLNKKYAVKVVSVKKKNSKKTLREVRALSDLLHHNIVRYYTCWMEDTGYMQDSSADSSSSQESQPQFLYIQMELCDSKTLKHWIKERNTRTLPDSNRRQESLTIAQQILSGVEHIHIKKLIHRDLKPANILFGPDGVVKIGDFGLVTADDDDDENPRERTNETGTPSYMAPEQFETIYDRKVDIFAFGLIYFELLWKVYTGHERVEVFRDAKNQKFPREFPLTFSQEEQIMRSMLCKEPKQRPEASALKAELEKLAHTLKPETTEHQQNVTV